MPSSDRDGSSLNRSGTDSKSDTPLTQRGSRHVRYRLISPAGHKYPPFILKPGATLHGTVGKAFAGEDGWDVEVVA